MLRHTLGFALALVTIGLSVSCSSESDDNSGTGATGGAGGSGGGGAGGTGGGEEDAGGVACGNTRCMPIEGAMGEPCCMDQFTSACGLRRGTACNPPPAVADPRCPSVPVAGITLVSCCTNGDCGIVAPAGFGGGGCTELADAQRQADELFGRFDGGIGFDAGFMFDGGGFNITFPPPQRCDR
jgi:hypothetical protein